MQSRLVLLLAVCVVATPARAESPEQAKATIAFLRRHQTTDGAFAADAEKKAPSLRATSAALRALKYWGAEVSDRAKIAEFVARCYDKESGGFADAPGGMPDVTATAIGIMALVELKAPTTAYEAGVFKFLGDNVKTFEEIRIAAAGLEGLEKRPPEVEEWLKRVEKLRQGILNAPAGAKAARFVGGATVAAIRLSGKVDDPAKVLAVLNAGQRPDGGFGKEEADKSDLETSYRVMRCYHMLKAKPDAARLQAFVAKCRNDDGGYAVAPGQPSSISGTYCATMIRHWLAQK